MQNTLLRILSLAVLVGCIPQTPTERPQTTPQAPTATLPDITETLTSTVTAAVTATATVTATTATPSPTSAVDASTNLVSLTVYPTLPDNVAVGGRMVFIEPELFYRFKIYLWNATTGDLKALLPEGKIAYQASVSLDNQWLAYNEEDGKPGEYDPKFDRSSFGAWTSLVVVDSSGKEHVRMAYKKDWGWLSRWLTNTSLIIRRDKPEIFHNLTAKYLLNPFTGKTVELPPDPQDIYVGSVDWNGMGSISYSATIRYRAYKGGKLGMVLEDLQTNQKLVDIPAHDSPAEWSPDGQQFIYVEATDYDQGILDFYLVDIQGKVTQLTHWGSSIWKINSYGYRWSPDGRKVAFWVRKASDHSDKIQLATLEVASGKVTIYSIEFEFLMFNMPVWSPDSNQLLVGTYHEDEEQKETILFDLEKGIAVHLKDGMLPVGWLNSPQ